MTVDKEIQGCMKWWTFIIRWFNELQASGATLRCPQLAGVFMCMFMCIVQTRHRKGAKGDECSTSVQHKCMTPIKTLTLMIIKGLGP